MYNCGSPTYWPKYTIPVSTPATISTINPIAGRACGRISHSFILSPSSFILLITHHAPNAGNTNTSGIIPMARKLLGVISFTASAVEVKRAACHTASLPVAVNVQCWAARRATRVVEGWR